MEARNDYYNMKPQDVRNVITMCENSGVASIAIEGYEWLMHQGLASETEYLRLAGYYHRRMDIFNLLRVTGRYTKIFGKELR